MQLEITHNIDKAIKYLQGVRDDQIPFALANALNDTAKDVANELTVAMDQYLDRPTPGTKKAWLKGGKFRGYSANKRNLTATIVPVRDMAAFLRWPIFGGTRPTKGAGTAVPYEKHARLNKYGNISGRSKGLIKNSKQFIGNIKGIDGVWERTAGRKDRGVKLIHAFEKVVKYKSQYPVFKIANRVANRRIQSNFARQFKRALASARPL